MIQVQARALNLLDCSQDVRWERIPILFCKRFAGNLAMNGKSVLACANSHHNEVWWERLTYRGYPVVRCKLCKKFIGYVRTQSSEKRRGLQTQDGEELTERDYE